MIDFSRPFTGFSQTLANFGSKFSTTATEQVITALVPIAYSSLALYITLWAFASARGSINEPWSDAIGRFVKVFFVTWLSLQVGTYNSYVAGMITGLKSEFINIVTATVGAIDGGGGKSKSVYDFLDQIFQLGMNTFNAIWQQGSFIDFEWSPFLVALILLFPLIIALLVAGAMCITTDLGLIFFTALGPISIFLLLFEPTKNFFTQWLSQVLNFLMVQFFASMLIAAFGVNMKLYLASLGKSVAGSSATAGIGDVMPLVLFALLMTYALTKITAWASAAVGGVEVAMGGIVQAVTGGASSLMRGAYGALGHLSPASLANKKDAFDRALEGKGSPMYGGGNGHYSGIAGNFAAIKRFTNHMRRNKVKSS
jgi:type IV secretion system protein VirB6